MPKVLDPAKKLTDEVAIRHLTKQGKIAANWEFWHDYGSHYDSQGNKRKEWSPFAKFYRNTDNLAERMMVVSGLPMVDGDGLKNEPKWENTGVGKFKEKNNLYKATIDGAAVTLIVRNDQPTGIPKNARLDFSPQLFLNGVEMIGSTPVLLPVDPKNPNYLNNTLEWDYGVCKRHFRQVEGRVHGYWIFAVNPGGDIRIKYNQTGDYRLKLGQFKVNEDEEFVPASVFASASYPFEVSDSATYYPDDGAAGVDGYVVQTGSNASWATLVGGAGDDYDYNVFNTMHLGQFYSGNSSNGWNAIRRGITVWPTNGLPDTATISATTASWYGESKADDGSNTPTLNVYSAAPASSTALAAGDYDSLGTTAYCDTAITYAGFSTAGYNDFAFNATGIAAVNLTGTTKIGTRNANYDVTGTPPTWGASQEGKFRGWTSEKGDGFKPKLVVTYTDVTDYPISASVDMGLAVTTTRTANFPRSPSHALGFAATASRATTVSRTASHDFGMAVTTVKVADHPRAPSVSLGFETSSSRATTVSRTSAHDLGYAVTATRTANYPRSPSHALGYSVTATRTADYPRTSSVAMGFAVTASRLVAWGRTASHALGWAVTASRGTAVSRTASHALGWAVTATRTNAWAKTADVAIGYAVTVTRGFAKIAEVTLGWFVGVVMRPRIHRRMSTTGTNRTTSTVGTNRDVSTTGTNRDNETW